MTNPPPAGWQPTGDPKADAKAAKAYAKAQRPWFKKKRFIIPIALVVLIVLMSALSGGDDSSSDDTTSETSAESTETTSKDSKDEKAEEKTTPKKSEPKDEGPKLTKAQQNAARSAKSYLDFKGFSRDGLIDQLSSEYGDDYDKKDATVAVDSLKVDWNANAVKSAESYLDMKGFSCQGLIDQLSSEYGDQFTQKQARHGAEKAGAC